jgi:hypothetical protein
VEKKKEAEELQVPVVKQRKSCRCIQIGGEASLLMVV